MRGLLALALLALPLLGAPGNAAGGGPEGLSAEEEALLEEIDLLLELEMLEAWDALEDPQEDVASDDAAPDERRGRRARVPEDSE